MRRSTGVGLLGLLFCCTSSGAAVRGAPSIERVTYKGWADAYRLTNGTVDLVVVPSVARIMRYGFVGGTNVLWENPTVLGKPIPLGEWPNTGGDKIWPWPQSEWGRRTGRQWPPPPGADQAPHGVEIARPDTLRLTSPLVAPYGIRIVRDIRLAPSGTQVTIRSRFYKVRAGADAPVGVWSITQLPVPDLALGRLLPASPLENGYKLMGKNPWKSVRREREFLLPERPTDTSAKLGADADLWAWVKGDLLYTQKIVGTNGPADGYAPGDRAQIYSHPDKKEDLARGITPYVELELTSPQKALRQGETLTLDVAWELRRIDPGQCDPKTLAGLLRG